MDNLMNSGGMRAIVLGLCMCGASEHAQASGNDASAEASARIVGRAGAGRTTDTSTASAAFYNPAGIVSLTGLNVSLGGGLMGFQSHASLITNIGGTSRNVGYLPIAGVGHAAIAYNLGNGLAFGLAMGPSYGLTVDYPTTWSGAALGTRTSLMTFGGQFVVSYALSSSFRIGGGPVIEQAMLKSKSMTPFGPVNRSPDTSIAAGVLLGAQWDAREGTTLGVTFRSAVMHRYDGTRSGLFPTTLATKNVSPATVTLGLRQVIDTRTRLYADLSWLGWSMTRATTIKEAGLPDTVIQRHWRDGYRISVGLDYDINQYITIRSGVAYSTNFIKKEFRFVDAPFDQQFRLSSGFTFNISTQTSLDVAYQYVNLGQNRVSLSAAATGGVSAVGKLPAHGHGVGIQLNTRF